MFFKAIACSGLALCALLPVAVSPAVSSRAASPDSCPRVEIERYQAAESTPRKYVLGATISGADPAKTPTYKWCISAGTITRGQGTYSVEIDASGVKAEGITATLMVGSFPWGCNNVATYQIELSEDSRPAAARTDNGANPTANQRASLRELVRLRR